MVTVQYESRHHLLKFYHCRVPLRVHLHFRRRRDHHTRCFMHFPISCFRNFKTSSTTVDSLLFANMVLKNDVICDIWLVLKTCDDYILLERTVCALFSDWRLFPPTTLVEQVALLLSDAFGTKNFDRHLLMDKNQLETLKITASVTLSCQPINCKDATMIIRAIT